jgi:hypothetical protein
MAAGFAVVVVANVVIGVTINIVRSGIRSATIASPGKEIADTLNKDREHNGKRCSNGTELDVFNLLFAKVCKDGVFWKPEF